MTTGEWFLGATTIFLGLIAATAIVINVWTNKKTVRENRRVESEKRELEIKAKALDDLKSWVYKTSEFEVFLSTAYGSEVREAATRVLRLIDESRILSILTSMFDNKKLSKNFKDLEKELTKLNKIMTSEPPKSTRKLIEGKKEESKEIIIKMSNLETNLLTELAKEKVKLYTSVPN